jgi:branched-chain amino acid transport system permease protein
MVDMLQYVQAVLLPQAIDGLIIASALILVALGLTLIFGLMHVINLAHGELYMLGAYSAFALTSAGAPFWLALVVGPVLVGMVGMAIERFGLRPMAGQRDFHYLSLLLTFGLSLVLRDLAQMTWGVDTQRVAPPLAGAIELGDFTVARYRLVMMLVAVSAIIGVSWMLYRTMLGAVLRAVAHDEMMARSLGVSVRRVQLGTFFFGSALAGFSGVLLAPVYSVFPGMGHDFVLLAFAVVIVGGIGSVAGAVVAGIALALVQSIGSLVVSPVWAETAVFVVMLVVLVFRPHGLFGRIGS